MRIVYSTVQVANVLNIGRSTVNKYARSLEEAGYLFTKDEKEHRAFVDHDIVAFRALLDFLNRGVEYQSAVSTVVERYKRLPGSDSLAVVATSGSSAEVATLNAKVDDLIAAVAALSGRIDEIVNEKVRLQVAAAAAEIGDQVNGVLDEVRQAQDRTDQQLTEIAGAVSRLELHGKRKRFFGLF
ncbi:hypothetical protein D1872_154630 [compost metagenome]